LDKKIKSKEKRKITRFKSLITCYVCMSFKAAEVLDKYGIAILNSIKKLTSDISSKEKMYIGTSKIVTYINEHYGLDLYMDFSTCAKKLEQLSKTGMVKEDKLGYKLEERSLFYLTFLEELGSKL
jgi:hypothetical protein